MQLGAVLCGEGHVGQHVGLALVHQRGKLRPAGTELVGDVAPDFHGAFPIGLVEGLQDRGGNDGVLALAFTNVQLRSALSISEAERPDRFPIPTGKLFVQHVAAWWVVSLARASVNQ